jgi:hypothetical protein
VLPRCKSNIVRPVEIAASDEPAPIFMADFYGGTRACVEAGFQPRL